MNLDITTVLTPNRLITLEVGSDMNRYAYASRVENIMDKTIQVATPSERGALVILQPGTEVRGFINHDSGKFFFISAVIGHQMEPIPTLVLSRPERLIKGQRRHYLRVKATIFPAESWLIDSDPELCRQIKAVIIDISGGGARLVGSDAIEKDSLVRLRLDLPYDCGTVDATARVIRVDERQDATRCRYESAIVFEDIPEGDRDRICKFALKQQLAGARAGLCRR